LAGRRDDATALLSMIKELAEFEKELDQVPMPLPSTRRPLDMTTPHRLYFLF